MNPVVIAALALALVFTVLALAHQIRLRRALEKLLSLILSRWRNHEKQVPDSDDPDPDRPDLGL